MAELREASIRACSMSAWRAGAVDERGFEASAPHPPGGAGHAAVAAFKAIVREQFYMLLIDQDAALAAIPSMLPQDPGDPTARRFDLITEVLSGARRT